MSANQTIIADVNSLTVDELAEQYQRLAETYKTLKRTYEDELQTSYELRRNYQTAQESVTYMTAELDSIDTVHKVELEKVGERYSQSLTALKETNSELKQQNTAQETTIESLQQQINQLNEKIEELESAGSKADSIAGNVSLSTEKESFLERENEELKQLVSDQQEKIDTLMLQMVNSESKLENLKEKLACIEDNLSAKKQELEELQTMLESTQEENMRLNADLAALNSVPDDANKKGNSLFAEVDDQRQKMIDMLQTQRKRYLEMKKLHTESQFQIRRLTRENRELCDDIRTCSELFLKADSSFRDEMNRQISQLTEEVQRLRDQLASTERLLVDRTGGTGWVDPFVAYYRNETNTLKTQLFQSQMAKRLVDEICFEAQQDLAKWRFEALKSRYTIINRESLLEEHEIAFPSFDSLQAGIHIDDNLIRQAKPHISFSMGTAKTDQKQSELDLLADLHIDVTIPAVDTLSKLKTPSLLLPPPPPPPPPAFTSAPTAKIKEEILTPLATPLVTPVQSPRSVNKEVRTAERSTPLVYRNLVFTPNDKPLSEKKNPPASEAVVAAAEGKENVPCAEPQQSQSQSKSWGWISEKRTKNNVVIRRFKFPDRKATPANEKQTEQ
ncbi:hypothetical protein quinque_013674 [Culex quinquefasciatus]